MGVYLGLAVASLVAVPVLAGLDRVVDSDAITVATALHWFDWDRIWDEVRRVARPPADGTVHRSPRWQNAMVLPSGEIAG